MLLKSPTGAPRGKKYCPQVLFIGFLGTKKHFFFLSECWHRFLSLFLHAKMSNKKKKRRKVNKVDKKTHTKKVSYALAFCDRKRLANVPLRMYRNKSATDSGSNGSPRRYQKE